MTTTPAPVATFHRLDLRPSARWTDLRLLAYDRRDLARRHRGLRYVDTLVCGSRRSSGLVAPASARERLVFAVWQDQDACERFLDGGTVQRWSRAAEVYTVQLHPFAARGTWFGTDALRDVPPSGHVDGPIAVTTHAWVPFRQLYHWHAKALPRAATAFHGAPGLLAYTGGGNVTGQRANTMTFWDSTRSMINAVYPKASPHGVQVPWAKGELRDLSFGRFRIGARQGTWNGTDPLAALDRSEAAS